MSNTNVNIAYLRNNGGGGGGGLNEVEITSQDESVSIEKTQAGHSVSFDLSAQGETVNVTSQDQSVAVSTSTSGKTKTIDLSVTHPTLPSVKSTDNSVSVTKSGSEYDLSVPVFAFESQDKTVGISASQQSGVNKINFSVDEMTIQNTDQTLEVSDVKDANNHRIVTINTSTSIGNRQLYVRNISEFIDACVLIAANYGVGYDMNILDTIDFRDSSGRSRASALTIHLKNESNSTDWTLYDSTNLKWEFRVLFRYTKIKGVGGIRNFQTLYLNNSIPDTYTLSWDVIYLEQIRVGGANSLGNTYSVQFNRPLMAAYGNGSWEFQNCEFTALGAVNDGSSYNPFFEIGSGDNRSRYRTGLYHNYLRFTNCYWRAAASDNEFNDTLAPLRISCAAASGYMHSFFIVNATRQASYSYADDGFVKIQFTGHTWKASSDGSALLTGTVTDLSARSIKTIVSDGKKLIFNNDGSVTWQGL